MVIDRGTNEESQDVFEGVRQASGEMSLGSGDAGLDVTEMWSLVWKGIFTWSETYRREERLGRRDEDRGRLGLAARLRAERQFALARLRQWRDPLSGGILCCWTAKAGS